jgi:hypothetical protein
VQEAHLRGITLAKHDALNLHPTLYHPRPTWRLPLHQRETATHVRLTLLSHSYALLNGAHPPPLLLQLLLFPLLSYVRNDVRLVSPIPADSLGHTQALVVDQLSQPVFV